MFWEARLDHRTGRPYSYNLRTSARVDDGLERVAAADAAAGGVRLLGTLRGGLPGLWNYLVGASSWDGAMERSTNYSSHGNGNGNGRSSLPSSVLLPLEACDVTWFQLKAHGDLHLLIDQMVRLKHLEMLQSAPKALGVHGSKSSNARHEDTGSSDDVVAEVDVVAETAKAVGAGSASGVKLAELLRWAEVIRVTRVPICRCVEDCMNQ